MSDDGPQDPFLSDPHDPAAALDPDELAEPLGPAEYEDVLADVGDLAVFEALLRPRGFIGVVVECEDCSEPHYFSWVLFRSNLQRLLETGQTPVHEPAANPDVDRYVSWEYARGYADAVMSSSVDESSSGQR